jgi:hypothetical protein
MNSGTSPAVPSATPERKAGLRAGKSPLGLIDEAESA